MDIQASILNTVRANRSDGQSASARENSGVAFGSLMRLAAGRTAQSATSGSGDGSGAEQRISSEGAAQSAETALARMAGEKSADDAEGGQTLPPSEVMDALEALLAKLGIDIPEEIGEILDEEGIEAAVKQLMATLSSSLKAVLAGDGVDDDLDDQMDDQMADATELLADADEETLGAALAALIDVQMTGADRVESLSTRMSGWAQEISGLGGGLSGLAAMFGRESTAIGRSRDSGPQTIVPQQNASGESGDAEAEIVGARPTGNGTGSSSGGADGDSRGRDGGANPDLRGRQFNDALFRLGADAPIDDGDAPTGLRTTFAAAGSDTMSMTPTSSAIGQGATAAGGAAAGLAAEAAAQRPGAGATPVQDQIALHLKKLADNGGDRLRLQLQPARLGGIDIVMEISRDGRVQAVIMADKAETLSLLQRDSRALEQALREADLTVDPDSLRFDMADRQDRNANGDDGASGSDRSLGDHLWMQGDNTADAADIIQPRASSLRAVDITI